MHDLPTLYVCNFQGCWSNLMIQLGGFRTKYIIRFVFLAMGELEFVILPVFLVLLVVGLGFGRFGVMWGPKGPKITSPFLFGLLFLFCFLLARDPPPTTKQKNRINITNQKMICYILDLFWRRGLAK